MKLQSTVSCTGIIDRLIYIFISNCIIKQKYMPLIHNLINNVVHFEVTPKNKWWVSVQTISIYLGWWYLYHWWHRMSEPTQSWTDQVAAGKWFKIIITFVSFITNVVPKQLIPPPLRIGKSPHLLLMGIPCGGRGRCVEDTSTSACASSSSGLSGQRSIMNNDRSPNLHVQQGIVRIYNANIPKKLKCLYKV